MLKRRFLTWGLVLVACSVVPRSDAWGQGSNVRARDLADESAASDTFTGQRGRIEAPADAESPVGRSAEDVRRSFRELLGNERSQSFDMSVENINERRNARRRQQRQRTPPPPVHVHLQPTFRFNLLASDAIAAATQTRISKFLAARDAGSVQVEVENRTARLSGTVRSEYERDLLEKLLAIEPGVSQVENLISVEAPVAQPQLKAAR